ncbi:hypothetical protein MCEMRE26_00140 [Candidatus Nanopelagicaceae bacterium]
MKNYKNYLIAILTGLFALSLSTQSSIGAPAKSYDAVKLEEYSTCLAAQYYAETSQMMSAGRINFNVNSDSARYQCRLLKP